MRPKRASFRLGAGALLKSRLALTLILVSGLMLTGTGTTLAITGDSGSGNAARSQHMNPGQNDVLLGKRAPASGGPGDPGDPQATAQESASKQSGLAFTGFMVIPLLIGGVALTATGVMRLRRDARG